MQPVRPSPRLLITAAYVHDLSPDQGAGFFRLVNPGPAPATLSGWTLEVDGCPLRFPPGAGLAPGAGLCVARDAVAFQRLLGRFPEWQYAGGGTRAPRLAAPAGVPQPSPWAGRAVLADPAGQPVNALAWGTLPAAVPGWSGPPLPSAPPGEVYLRAWDEASGRFLDTGRREDWKQGGHWLPLRSYRVGQTNLPPAPWMAVAGPVVASVAPDCTLAALVPVLAGARRSIDLNLYQITSSPLAEELAAAAGRGVAVRVLLDGTPFGKLLDKTRYLARVLADQGVTVRWLAGDAGVQKRYVYNHAKYALVDGEWVLAWSENWSAHSFPVVVGGGNRGWGVAVRSRPLARYLAAVFAADFDPGRPDSLPLLPGHPLWGGLTEIPDPRGQDPAAGYRPRWQPLSLRSGCRVQPVVGPDHALLERGGVLGLLRRASRTLAVQCQYIPPHWGMPDHGSPEETPNLYLAAVLAAARRGVQVRVLAGNRQPEPWSPQDSLHTVDYLNTLARRERLDLAARLENPAVTGLTIHNKGVLVDGRWSLIASINWSENAPGHNRELGLIVDSPAVAGYFGAVFSWDWDQAAP